MAAAQPSFATIRLVTRLAVPCTLDGALAGRRERDFLDALILMAVVQANVGPIMRDPALQRAYAGADEPPPDELRRPVSVNAVAHSLRLPYETVRRRIARLAAAGACEASAAGIIVPARELATPEHTLALMAVWDQIRRLYLVLRDHGLIDEMLSRSEGELWVANAAEPPLRAVIRVASDYLLRTIDSITRHLGGMIPGIIWFAILRANTEDLPATDGGGATPSLADFIADSRRRPVSVVEIARRLGAPHETVRRYVAGLVADGLCRRVRGGLIVPADVLARPAAVKVMRHNFADLQRMFTGFARLGVLADWDRQAPTRRAGAA